MFERLDGLGFDLKFTFHADAILSNHFPGAVTELDEIISETHLPITEIIGGGGGEAKVTQRLRHDLANHGWAKTNFNIEKRINDNVTYATSHEVDHVKRFESGTIALEIEWNNKDPFFDRDLENFHRLHADGAISLGIIVTLRIPMKAASDSDGKAATDSDPKRPLFQRADLAGAIFAVG